MRGGQRLKSSGLLAAKRVLGVLCVRRTLGGGHESYEVVVELRNVAASLNL